MQMVDYRMTAGDVSHYVNCLMSRVHIKFKTLNPTASFNSS